MPVLPDETEREDRADQPAGADCGIEEAHALRPQVEKIEREHGDEHRQGSVDQRLSPGEDEDRARARVTDHGPEALGQLRDQRAFASDTRLALVDAPDSEQHRRRPQERQAVRCEDDRGTVAARRRPPSAWTEEEADAFDRARRCVRRGELVRRRASGGCSATWAGPERGGRHGRHRCQREDERGRPVERDRRGAEEHRGAADQVGPIMTRAGGTGRRRGR